jgi:hypothetical protein
MFRAFHGMNTVAVDMETGKYIGCSGMGKIRNLKKVRKMQGGRWKMEGGKVRLNLIHASAYGNADLVYTKGWTISERGIGG